MRTAKLSLCFGLALLAATPARARDGTGEAAMSGTGPAAAAPVQPSSDFYCKERKLGTWFYCDRARHPAVPRQTAAAPAATATAALAEVTRQLDELKARAVLEPTEENVTAYIRYQRAQLDRASTFSDVWQRAVWQDPDLDYTLQRPVSTLGKRAWLDNRKDEQEQALRHLSARYGIFYFYAQSCGACEVFAPILKALSDRSGFDVVAVSMDGGPNRVFPEYVVDSGQHIRMGLTSRATPALVLYDTATRRPIPIGTGILSQDEIAQRIFVLTRTRPGSDF